jgi:hypothetical protein
MKRLITCATLMLVAAVVFVVARERSAARAADSATRAADAARVDRVPSATAVSEPHPLRNQLLLRLKAKVDLMTDEQLQQSLETTDAEIRALQSERRLRDAVQILSEVTEEYEGTPSAAIAQDMLSIHELRGESTMTLPFYNSGPQPVRPIPDYQPDGELEPSQDSQQPES